MLAVPVARPWRRFLRFSVRGLIVVVLVIGVWLGWLVRSARIQREAVAAIEKAGGQAYYDWEWNDGKETPEGKPQVPGWLVGLIGVDYFNHVTYVVLPHATDTAISQIGRLSQLEKLHLELGSSQVTDDCLAHLSGLPNLSILSLNGTHVTDAGLAHLKKLTNLSTLYLGKTQVTDDGLAHLKGLTKLSQLDLGYTKVTDAGLAHLKGLMNLSALGLLSTKITDAGLVHLKGLAHLSKLDLSYTWITDAALRHLKGLTKLSALNLYGTHVTDAGVKDLKQALPSLKITRR